jgi:hypothetical protein
MSRGPAVAAIEIAAPGGLPGQQAQGDYFLQKITPSQRKPVFFLFS